MPQNQPTKDDVLASLASAADAAQKAYMTALAANPTADLTGLAGRVATLLLDEGQVPNRNEQSSKRTGSPA